MEDDLKIAEEADDIQSIEDIDRLLNAGATPSKPAKLPNISKMPTGKIVEAILDASGSGMTADERKKVVEITDDEAMAAFLDANLGTEPVVNELKARSLFGTYMMQRMDHKAIGFATRYYNIRSTQECIDFAMRLATKEGATDDSKVNAAKLWLTGNRELSVMLKRYVDMAQEMAPPDRPPTGQNAAPDIFVENAQILVQRTPSG